MTILVDEKKIQVLRTIDKFDKIGRDGVVELLQQPVDEFGAELSPVQAHLIAVAFSSLNIKRLTK